MACIAVGLSIMMLIRIANVPLAQVSGCRIQHLMCQTVHLAGSGRALLLDLPCLTDVEASRSQGEVRPRLFHAAGAARRVGRSAMAALPRV